MFLRTYLNLKTDTGDFPQNKSCPTSIEPTALTSHSHQTRESSISPGCHGPIFCTWPTLPMRPEPICIARERHGASVLVLIVPAGDGIPSEICFNSGDVVDIILI